MYYLLWLVRFYFGGKRIQKDLFFLITCADSLWISSNFEASGLGSGLLPSQAFTP